MRFSNTQNGISRGCSKLGIEEGAINGSPSQYIEWAEKIAHPTGLKSNNFYIFDKIQSI